METVLIQVTPDLTTNVVEIGVFKFILEIPLSKNPRNLKQYGFLEQIWLFEPFSSRGYDIEVKNYKIFIELIGHHSS